jgi:hypothetical protein
MKPSKLSRLHEEAAAPLRLIATDVLGDAVEADEIVRHVLGAYTAVELRHHEGRRNGPLVEAVLEACNDRLGLPANDNGDRGDQADKPRPRRETPRTVSVDRYISARYAGVDAANDHADEDDLL